MKRFNVLDIVLSILLAPIIVFSVWAGFMTLSSLHAIPYIALAIVSIIVFCILWTTKRLIRMFSYSNFFLVYLVSSFIVLIELMALYAILRDRSLVDATGWKMMIQLGCTLPLIAVGLLTKDAWIRYSLIVGGLSCILLTPAIGSSKLQDMSGIIVYFIVLAIVSYIVQARDKHGWEAIITSGIVAAMIAFFVTIVSVSVLTLIYLYPFWGHWWA